ncbi:MAG TPA: ester cyclase, partial [Microlunatus sp.]|nr:ester cyclase [Microlunatus sp.]
ANKLIAYRYFDQRWNHHNADIIDELLGEGMSIDAEKTHLEATHTAFSDLHVTIHDQIAENDEVVVRWTATGRQNGEPPDSSPPGPTITFRGLARLRIHDGKIVDFEGFSDLAETMGIEASRVWCTPC